jgi:hypothetical protein
MDPTQLLVILLVGTIMGWYGFGVVVNVRRGNAVLKWMQTGLPRLGQKTTLRWLGSSAVQLGIAKARAPFRRAELLLVLEPRDVPWLWLPARQRGRRDMLIFRGQLVNAPRFEYDLLAPGSWSERERMHRPAVREWQAEDLDGINFRAPAATRSLSRQEAPEALKLARQLSATVWRLSSRREYPQLELHIPLPDPRRDDAASFFASLRSLAQIIGPSPSP